MDKPETKANEEWTNQNQRQKKKAFAFVSDLSIHHLPLSLVCPFFIKANEEWTSQRQRQMKNGQTRDKGK
jgi:hypothetical protein